MATLNALLCSYFILVLFGTGASIKIDDLNREGLKKATDNFKGKPPALIYPGVPTVSKDWTPNCKLYFLLPYIIFDPLSQFGFLFQDDPLRCPLCDPGHEESRTIFFTANKFMEEWTNEKALSQGAVWCKFDCVPRLQNVLPHWWSYRDSSNTSRNTCENTQLLSPIYFKT